ncbi:hypothetical protein JCM10207_002750, partial [Rhodosporidiobolus poonsookiae]
QGAQTFSSGVIPLPDTFSRRHDDPSTHPPTSAKAAEHEKPFTSLPPRPSTAFSLPTGPRAGGAPVMLHLPLAPVLSPGGTHRVRNYALHEGRNRFLLGGRLVSSGDGPWPFVASAVMAVAMPALWWAFNGAFLWDHLGGGGKASVFVFAYLVLIMWTSM